MPVKNISQKAYWDSVAPVKAFTLGLDFSGAMIRRGKILFPHLQLKKAGGRHTNLPDASVDRVLLFALLAEKL